MRQADVQPGQRLRVGEGCQDRRPFVAIKQKDAASSCSTRRSIDSVAAQEAAVALQVVQMCFNTLQSNRRIRHHVVEVLHQQRFGQHQYLRQSCSAESWLGRMDTAKLCHLVKHLDH